jgi:Tfp pilus assembly protein PilF
MFAAGVACSDCHEPHRLGVRAEGNALCATCHRPESFDVPAHHRHPPGSAGAACVSCHMPARTYMGVDVRHDHSFRVPRPDLSVALGTPNACTDCHARESARWAADAVAGWFPNGRSGAPHYGIALHAGRTGQAGAEAKLRALAGDAAQPAIVRATALGLLAAPDLPESERAIRSGLADADPWLRLGALAAADGLAPAARLAAAAPLLSDPLLAVRIDAARVLADAPAEALPGGRQERALAEYRAAQEVSADRPEAHVSLGVLALRRGDPAGARAAYETALRLAPWYVPAWLNLADLERSAGREDAAERALRRALAAAPDAAEPHFALGLLFVRTGRADASLAELERAAELAPANAHFALVYAVALHDAGDAKRALAVLEAALARRPADRLLLDTAAEFAREAGDSERARRHALAREAAWPDEPPARGEPR